MVAKEDLNANDFLLRFKAAGDSLRDNRRSRCCLEIVATHGIHSSHLYVVVFFFFFVGSRVRDDSCCFRSDV